MEQQVQKFKQGLKRIFNPLNQTVYNRLKINRTVSIRQVEDVFIPELVPETLSETGFTIYPEFFMYAYYLEGCPKLLFFYLVFHQVNLMNGEFLYNASVAHEFAEYCNLVEGKRYSSAVTKKALSTLVNKNLVLNIERGNGRYLVNPVVVGGKTIAERRVLIKAYSYHLVLQGKDPITQFYPNFNK